MKKVKRIPEFESIAEEAKFWDSHDLTDYLAEMKEVKIDFKLKAPKEEILAIRVQPGLKQSLEKIARTYGINVSTLARLWLIERLRRTEKPKLAFR